MGTGAAASNFPMPAEPAFRHVGLLREMAHWLLGRAT
jgi:hypothetical protein